MKKDLRAVWPLWLTWLGLIAIRIPLLVYYMNHAGEKAFKMLSVVTGVAIMADVILIASLVRSLVQEDAVVGDKVAWITRPISGARLLVAKGLSAVLVCVVSPLVFLLPLWLAFDCGGSDLIGVLAFYGMAHAGVMIAAFLFAVVTERGSPFWLVAIAAGVVIAVIATGVEEGLNIRLIRSNLVYWSVVLGGLGLIAFGIAQQYVKRRVGVTRFILGVLVVVTGCLLPSSSGKTLRASRAKSIEHPVAVSWSGDGVSLLDKGQGCATGKIEVRISQQYSSIHLRYLNGVWVNSEGRVEHAEWVDKDGSVRAAGWDSPRFISVSKSERIYRFPVILSARSLGKSQPWSQTGFAGRVSISLRRQIEIANTELAVGAKAHAENYRAWLGDVTTYENALALSTVEAWVGVSSNPSRSPTILSQTGPAWSMKVNSWGGAGMLLWVQLQRHRRIYTQGDRNLGNWLEGSLGAETHENLTENGWRVSWKREISVGRGDFDLKADQLTISKTSAP